MEHWPEGEWRYRVRQPDAGSGEWVERAARGREAVFRVEDPAGRVEVEREVGGEWVAVRAGWPEVLGVVLRLELKEGLKVVGDEIPGREGMRGVVFVARVGERIAAYAVEGDLDLCAGTRYVKAFPVQEGMAGVVGEGEFVIEAEWGRVVSAGPAVVEWRSDDGGKVSAGRASWVYMVSQGRLPAGEMSAFRRTLKRMGR